MRLQISYVTTYAYRIPIEILPHRMMLNPRGSHAPRVITADIGRGAFLDNSRGHLSVGNQSADLGRKDGPWKLD
jgi:hypothetical protein